MNTSWQFSRMSSQQPAATAFHRRCSASQFYRKSVDLSCLGQHHTTKERLGWPCCVLSSHRMYRRSCLSESEASLGILHECCSYSFVFSSVPFGCDSMARFKWPAAGTPDSACLASSLWVFMPKSALDSVFVVVQTMGIRSRQPDSSDLTFCALLPSWQSSMLWHYYEMQKHIECIDIE